MASINTPPPHRDRNDLQYSSGEIRKVPTSSVKSAKQSLHAIFSSKIQVGDQTFSIKELSESTGFSGKEIKKLSKSGNLSMVLSRTVTTDQGAKKLGEISQETGFSLAALSKMKDDKIKELFTKPIQIDNQLMTRAQLALKTGLSIKELCDLETSGELLGHAMVKTSSGFTSVADVIHKTGFTTLELLQLKKGGLLTSELISLAGERKAGKNPILSVGNSSYDLNKLIRDTGFSFIEIFILKRDGLLTPQLIQEAIALKQSASGIQASIMVVENAIVRDLPGKEAFKPKDYQRAYVAMQHLASQYNVGNGGAQVAAVKTDEQLTLLDVRDMQTLGEGSFGSVSKVYDIAEQRDIAVKSLREGVISNDIQFHKRQFMNGAQILRKIYVAFPGVRGIVSKVQVEEKTGHLFGDKYVGDATSIDQNSFTSKQVQTMFRDGLSALRSIHQIGIFHGDIKPKNMLVDVHGAVLLADWDGSIDSEAPCSDIKTCLYIHTREYITFDEAYVLEDLPISEVDTASAQELLAKRDALAAGLSYIEVLTKKKAVSLLGFGYAKPEILLSDPAVWQTLKKKGLTNEQVNGLKWMIHPDVSQRKTATEVIDALEGKGLKLPRFPSQEFPSQEFPSQEFLSVDQSSEGRLTGIKNIAHKFKERARRRK